MVWENYQINVQANIPTVVVQMNQEAGNEVLYSLPHNSDLQPIETVRAIVKRDAGRQYSTETTFKDVLEHLRRSFHTVQDHTVQGGINKANLILKMITQAIDPFGKYGR